MESIPKHLRVERAGFVMQPLKSGARLRNNHLQKGAGHAGAQTIGVVDREQAPLVEHRYTAASLGLVEVWRRHDDGDAAGQKL